MTSPLNLYWYFYIPHSCIDMYTQRFIYLTKKTKNVLHSHHLNPYRSSSKKKKKTQLTD